MQQSWCHNVKTLVLYGFAYLAADTALNRFAFSDGWTIVWPLNGVTVALLLMRPRSSWLWMLLGIELGTGVGEWLDSNSLGSELGQRVCSAAEVLICAALLPSYSSLESWLNTQRLMARFVTALIAGPSISGLMAAILFHYTQGELYLVAFNNWATADALGIAATMPLVLTLSSGQMRALFSRQMRFKTVATLALACCGSALIFTVSRYPLLFLLYPLLLLVDSLLAFAGSAIAIVAVCFIAVYCTTHGWGPFGTWPARLPVPPNLALQLFFGFHVLALFPFSILLMGRQRMADDLVRSNARLEALASIDGLTGIGNRRVFDEKLDEAWTRAVEGKSSLAVAVIDLDNFKQFNDLYGHPAGDKCLRAVAGALESAMVPPKDLAARFGGEEFVVLLPDSSAEEARNRSEQIRAAILRLNISHVGNSWNRVSVSIGYASIEPSANDAPLSLIQLADAALYRAKRQGRNRVETISSIEGLRAANDHFGDTTQVRLMRLIRPRE